MQTEASQPILLIDGRNCAYRALFANQGNQEGRYHNFVVMLRFLSAVINKLKPKAMHMFWDAKRESLWRRQLLETYKVRPDSGLIGIKEQLGDLLLVATNLFKFLNVRQFKRNTMEADDLIYAACRVLCPQDVVIVSSDGDFKQIPYFMPHVRLYEPKNGEFVERPSFNPVVRKALMGDSVDCVPGYEGIGEKKSLIMTESITARKEFLDRVGDHIYCRNLLLVDLNLCPDLIVNELYIASKLTSEIAYDRSTLYKLADQYKVGGLVSEYERIASPFKRLT